MIAENPRSLSSSAMKFEMNRHKHGYSGSMQAPGRGSRRPIEELPRDLSYQVEMILIRTSFDWSTTGFQMRETVAGL
jgi:hypothetical protein